MGDAVPNALIDAIRTARRSHSAPRLGVGLLWVAVLCAGCDPGAAPLPPAPPGGDTDQPFPLDRGDESADTPGTYKGLPLRLVDNGRAPVAPVDGRVGVVCVGMSNATQECSHYIGLLAGRLAPEVSTRVVVVDCAVGGHAIERWIDPAFDDVLWRACIDRKIGAAGLALEQIRVIYHKAANQQAYGPAPYPAAGSDYDAFVEHLDAFAGRVRAHFPAAQAVYTTSRSYGGFSDRADRGEPRSYEEGHALNTWLASHAIVDGIWYGWGPYIWAPDCASGERSGAGVCYVRDDFQADAIHPAAGARDIVAELIHRRFSREPWYVPGPDDPPPPDEPPPMGACAADAECADGDPCTRNACAAGVCQSDPVPRCTSDGIACAGNAECDDGDPLTQDRCVEGACAHRG